MGYQKKYYKEIHSQGHLWRLEILQDTDAWVTLEEIGPVLQDMRIVVQGDQAEIDTPIVKTSLEMTFIDAPDLEYTRKCGYWEEFYTSSATEYKVQLYKDDVLEWTGYITPDSFSEELRHRGSVSIIARDNLGYLQDIEYEPSNTRLIQFGNLITDSLAAVSFGMSLRGLDDRTMPVCISGGNTTSISNISFNSSAFFGKNLWEAIEDTMLSLGLTMRYVGRNEFVIAPIRYMHMGGHATEPEHTSVRFLAGARRELAPSTKKLVDSVEYELTDEVIQIVADSSCYDGKQTTLTFSETTFGFELASENEIPVEGFNPRGTGVDALPVHKSRVLNPFRYKIRNGDKRYGPIQDPNVLYVMCNVCSTNSVNQCEIADSLPLKFSTGIQMPGELKISLVFGRPVALYDNMTSIGYYTQNPIYADMEVAKYGIKASWYGEDGKNLYLKQTMTNGASVSGQWVEESQSGVVNLYSTTPHSNLTADDVLELPILHTSSNGSLYIEFYGALLTDTHAREKGSAGAYIKLKEAKIESANSGTAAKSLRVTTPFSNANSILVSRDLPFGPNSGIALAPHLIVNSMYVINDDLIRVGAEEWKWQNEASIAAVPLSAIMHKQLLCYSAKPMNLLTGELYNPDGGDLGFDMIYDWDGKEHILISGQFNILTGRIEGATLREFMRYETIWQ